MKRLPKVIITISLMSIILIIMFIIGLKFLFPNINKYNHYIENKIQSLILIPIKINKIKATWSFFYPTFTIENISIFTKQITIKIKKIKFSFNIWKSLFLINPYFNDIFLYQLNIKYKNPFNLVKNNYFNNKLIKYFFFKQFKYLQLKDSQIIFNSISNKSKLNKYEILKIPKLIWLNTNKIHKAQAHIFLHDINKQQSYNSIQIKLYLINQINNLHQGIIYLQANNINLDTFINYWLNNKYNKLEKINLNFSTWIKINNDRIDNTYLKLNNGQINWKIDNKKQILTINNFLLLFSRQKNGWLINIPKLQNLNTNHKKWLNGQFALLFLPKYKNQKQNYWRIRISNIDIEQLITLSPIFFFFKSKFIYNLQKQHIKGHIIKLALDFTPHDFKKTTIYSIWKNVSWKYWKNIPSINNFNGVIKGTYKKGQLSFNLNNSYIYSNFFKVPFKNFTGKGTFFWSKNNTLNQIWSKNIHIQAKSLRIVGKFRYYKTQNQKPILSILGALKLNNNTDIWRYYPSSLINKKIINYLTNAIGTGYINKTTIIFRGNPTDFPFKKNNGQFQVFAPIRNTVFKYKNNWPSILNLNTNLLFENNKFYLYAPKIKLNDLDIINLNANIIDFNKKKLLVDFVFISKNNAISNFFINSSIEKYIKKILQSVKITGKIYGKLKLEISLMNKEKIIFKGYIEFNKNNIFFTKIKNPIQQLTGRIYFKQNIILSNILKAFWFNQPIKLIINTNNKNINYKINIFGNWDITKINILPKTIIRYLSNNIKWQAEINIQFYKINKNINFYIKICSFLNPIIKKKLLFNNKTTNIIKTNILHINIKGNIDKLQIYGDINQKIKFNTQWNLNKNKIILCKGIIQSFNLHELILPKNKLIIINLNKIQKLKLISLLNLLKFLNKINKDKNNKFIFPNTIVINISKIFFAKQQWNNIKLKINKNNKYIIIYINSNEFKGNFKIPKIKHNTWIIEINYINYNPTIKIKNHIFQQYDSSIKYYQMNLPRIHFSCFSCNFLGYNLGKIEGKLFYLNSILNFDVFLQNQKNNLNFSGTWNINDNKTKIKGILKGDDINKLAKYYDVLIPIKQSTFNIIFNLNWPTIPWNFNINNLNGHIIFNLTKGGIIQMGGGNTGKLLRFISFDAFLRKLKLDFSDIFSNDFEFDSINGNASINEGILNTDNLYIDGLMADIKIKGKINLINFLINLDAIVIPEISTTLGIATAFTVHPFVGAAIFAISKMLGSWWNKLPIIHYKINGDLNHPKIDKI